MIEVLVKWKNRGQLRSKFWSNKKKEPVGTSGLFKPDSVELVSTSGYPKSIQMR